MNIDDFDKQTKDFLKKIKEAHGDAEKLKSLFEEANKIDEQKQIAKLQKRSFIEEKRQIPISENIKHYRKNNNLSQEGLAERLNVDRGTVINWESGKTAPNAWQIEDMASLFNIRTEELHTKTIWNYNDSNEERKTNAKLEEKWREKHPATICEIPNNGYVSFWASDFARDYFHPERKEMVIIALELALRGYIVTELCCPFRESEIDPLDSFYAPLDLYIKEGQSKSLNDSISEIIIDYASNTSRFDEVIELRKRTIKQCLYGKQTFSDVLYEIEEEKDPLKQYCVAYAIDNNKRTKPLFSGTTENVLLKLKEAKINNFELDRVFINESQFFKDIKWEQYE